MIPPEITSGLFLFMQKPYNLRHNSGLKAKKTEQFSLVLKSVSLLAPKLWEVFLKTLKRETSVNIFKDKMKSWSTDKSHAVYAKCT